MSPDDISTVDRSWADLRFRQIELVEHLEATFRTIGPDEAAEPRAQWLVHAVAELIGLLSAPSALGNQARSLAGSWPLTDCAPSFAIDGEAWMGASRELCPLWTDRTEQAWRHAWLLLSDVLAEEALSPFTSELS